MTTKYLLTIGDEIITVGTIEQIRKLYSQALKDYDGRPSREPNIWKWLMGGDKGVAK